MLATQSVLIEHVYKHAAYSGARYETNYIEQIHYAAAHKPLSAAVSSIHDRHGELTKIVCAEHSGHRETSARFECVILHSA